MQNLLFAFFTLTVFFLNAQQPFAPIGAKWYYTPHCMGPPNCEYFSIEAVSDTLIDGQAARKMVYTRHTVTGDEIVPEATMFMYGDGDKIYYYFEDEFHVLYDFSAAVGDTIEVELGPFANFYQLGSGMSIMETQSLRVRVESVATTTIGEENLRTIEYRDVLEDPNQIWGLGAGSFGGGDIMERIGNTKAGLFGESLTQILAGFSGIFRCYEDSGFFYQNPDFDLPCDYLPVNSVEEFGLLDFQVFPNPADDFISIKNQSSSSELLSIQIISLEGKKLLDQFQTITPNEIISIDVGDFRAGIYLLRVGDSERAFVQKVIISGR